MLVEINPATPEPRKIRRVVDALEAGEVIAYPTDTVYGLGCDLLNKKAVDRLYQIKGIDRSQMLAFVCRSLGDIAKYAVMHDHVYRILKQFLPGPYCFILEATREVPRLIQTQRKTVGIRIPNHPIALALVAELGRPIISSTAARHGQAPSPDPRELDREFPGLSLVLDAGPCGTEPTTVIDLTTPRPKILRAGAGDTAPFEE
ncbi:MAG TPA: L-threonylcarbamoyladenylate synthase [Polyangiaceae bacterium]|jgi:tRNA threonylcarbamoyl adenosine modification protein (Sua5/YciO/YrdC/YwlC family)|nr:L-threonylcarbamoyladenylate synthase [Polyangiaceae bacterium]